MITLQVQDKGDYAFSVSDPTLSREKKSVYLLFFLALSEIVNWISLGIFYDVNFDIGKPG